MQKLPDISEWYSRERAQEEEVAWVTDPKGHQTYLDFLRPHLVEAGIKTVLDCGCGSGILASGLPDTVEYLGVDKNVHFLEMARRRHGRENRKTVFRCWDVRNLEPVMGLYDLSMCWAFLKHFSLDEFDAILSKVLSLGRYAAFDVQVADREFDDGKDFHHTHITPARLISVLARHAESWDSHKLWEFAAPGGMAVSVMGVWAKRQGGTSSGSSNFEKVEETSGWDIRQQTLVVGGKVVADLENYSLRWVTGGDVWAEPVLYHKGKRVTSAWSIKLDVDTDADPHGGNANTE